MEFIIGLLTGVITMGVLTFYPETRIYIKDLLSNRTDVRKALNRFEREYINIHGVPPRDFEKDEFVKDLILKKHLNE